eukprot:TRINITY_DN7661_c0_g1_i1.p1 TRINITY_DN7661_c0_g1~~TRINITY_DN7661_c0_g1_i1.p1  ORF type:complete len:425 (+),score=133.54 TRINITY_DN7661_c0_g1_i1:85-1359(+)
MGKGDDKPAQPSRDDLEKALSGRDEDELKMMAQRLAKSRAGMTDMIQDLEAEKKSLEEENAHFRQTIELMMKELKKLNIGSLNCVDPTLDEGPLDFVNRFWERVRPRDTAYVVDEHHGEIKKPSQEEGSGNGNSPGGYTVATTQIKEQLLQQHTQVAARSKEAIEQGKQALEQHSKQALEHGQKALEQGKQAVEQGKQAWGRLSENLGQNIGPWWQKGLAQAEGLLREVHLIESTGPTKAEEEKKKRKEERKAKAKEAKEGKNSEEADEAGGTENGSGGATSSDAAAAEPAAGKEQPAASGAAGADADTTSPPAADAAAAEAAAASSASAAPAEDTSGAEQISSTILIEASIKLDDGSVQNLQVRAADRCKEVAHRFVQEHSLKAWFEEPLTTWLKKVEHDAEKFPVQVDGDLLEIRKTHSKKK